MFTKEEKGKLKEIESLLDQIENIYNSFGIDTKEYIRQYHNAEGSLPHCIRWGIQGVNELLKEENAYEIGTTFVVKKKLEFADGYVPEGARATIEVIYEAELKDEDLEPFQFHFDSFVADEKENERESTWENLSIKKVKEFLKII